MADAQSYASWITANKDKAGTPEFLTVANAYQQARKLEMQKPEIVDNFSADPTEGMSGGQKFLAGMGKGMTDLARGAGQMMGLVDRESIDESKARDAPLMKTGAGIGGNILGTIAGTLPTMMIPGVNTAAGATAMGAGIGALAPVGEEDSRMTNMAAGAAGGFVGNRLTNALSRMLSPQTPMNVSKLIDEGITPTPGQILGGGFNWMEETAQSMPFVGTGISQAKTRGMEQFNKAALNRVLSPIGKTATAAGREGVDQAHRAVSQYYDDALATLGRVDVDQTFLGELANVKQMAKTFVPARQQQLMNILQDQVESKLTPAGTMSGGTFQQVSSSLRTMARKLGASQDFDQQQLGDALMATVDSMHSLAARNSPQAGELIKNANRAFANLVRVERAAGGAGATGGVFTPAQLSQAVRAADSSARKSQFARGGALMQDLTDPAKEILGSKLANSGTADRLLGNLTLGGVVAGAGAINPMAAALTGGTALAARGAYTPTMQKILAAALTQRGPMMRAAGDAVRLAGPAGTVAGAELVQ